MTLKFVILFALVALAYGLPASDRSENSEVFLASETVDGLLNDVFTGGVREVTLVLDSNDDVDAPAFRQKRMACRTVQARSRSGRTITVRRC